MGLRRFSEWVRQNKCIILAAILLLVIFLVRCKFQLAYVPSASMEKTIMTGEYVIIKRTDSIETGDIVAFYSEENAENMVKRCIGCPGDVVDVREGSVYLNGVFLTEEYVSSHTYETETFIVPEDAYLFMGDNRANSMDARSWKNPYIEKEDVFGKVICKVYPTIKKFN